MLLDPKFLSNYKHDVIQILEKYMWIHQLQEGSLSLAITSEK